MSDPPNALVVTPPSSGPTVRFDVFHEPFADVLLPNDFATRLDPTSPTRLRLNASIVAGTTKWERATRAELDKLSGWGTRETSTLTLKPIVPMREATTFSAAPQPSWMLPHSRPWAAQVVETHARHTLFSHLSLPERRPQSSVPPQPSSMVPQLLPRAAHVVDWQQALP